MKKTAATAILAVIIFLGASPALAQTANQPEQQATIAQNFVYIRFGSASQLWVSYQRSLKPVFGSPVFTIGVAPDPHGSYREFFTGVGFNLNRDKYGVMPTAVFTATTDGPHMEFWFSPWAETEKWSLNSFIGTYVPLSDRGFTQFFLDPVTLTRKLNKRIAVGVSALSVHTVGSDPRNGVGPALQIYIPKGLVIVDFFRGIGKSPNEARVTFQVSF